MKKFPLYHPICFGLGLVSLLLPCRTYDQYSSSGWFSTPTLVQGHVVESGLSFFPCYIPLLAMLVISFIVLIKKNLATGIIGLIFGFVLVLYLPVLLFMLTFELFGSKSNLEPGLGYVALVFICLTYFAFLIRNLVLVVRQRRKGPERKEQLDLLDDF